MRYLLPILWLLFPVIASAETSVIYRKSDKLVAGYVFNLQSVNQEISNITKSELGGSTSDYVAKSVPNFRPGDEVTIDNSDNVSVITIEDKQAQKEDSRKSKADVIRKKLGLTVAEFETLREALQ